MTDKRLCDFCSDPQIKWKYPANDFMVIAVGERSELPWASEGDWAACATCHALIEAGEADALLDRSINTMQLPLPPAALEMTRDMMRALHMGFVASRTGPAEPTGPAHVCPFCKGEPLPLGTPCPSCWKEARR